jgi:hypothetical protein
LGRSTGAGVPGSAGWKGGYMGNVDRSLPGKILVVTVLLAVFAGARKCDALPRLAPWALSVAVIRAQVAAGCGKDPTVLRTRIGAP